MAKSMMLVPVVILRMPPMDNEERKLLYEAFVLYDNDMCMGCIQDGSPNIIVSVPETNATLIGLVKNYTAGVEEIEVSDIPTDEDNWLIMNKLLWPRR